MSGTNAPARHPVEARNERRAKAVAMLASGVSYGKVSDDLGLPPGLVASWGRAAIAAGELEARVRRLVSDAPPVGSVPVGAVDEPQGPDMKDADTALDASTDVSARDPVPTDDGVPESSESGRKIASSVPDAAEKVPADKPYLAEWIHVAGGTPEGVAIVTGCLDMLAEDRSEEETGAAFGLAVDVVHALGRMAADLGVRSNVPPSPEYDVHSVVS